MPLLTLLCCAIFSGPIQHVPPYSPSFTPQAQHEWDSLLVYRAQLKYPQDLQTMRAVARACIRLAQAPGMAHELPQLYTEYGKMYLDERQYFDSCRIYLNKAESLLPAGGHTVAHATLATYKAWYHSVMNDSTMATHYLGMASNTLNHLGQVAPEVPENQRLFIKAYLIIGGIYQALNQYDSAMANYYAGLSAATLAQDTTSWAKYHIQIGELHQLIHQPGTALENYRQVVSLVQRGKAPKSVANAHNRMGEIAMATHDYPMARGHFWQALAVLQANALPAHMVYLNLGRAYAHENRPDSAFHYLQQADTTFMHYRFKTLYFQAMSLAFLSQNQDEKALTYALQGVAYARAEVDRSRLRQMLGLLVGLYKTTGQWQQAFAYQEELHGVERQLMDDTKQRTIAEMEAQYQAERKEQQIAALAQENAYKDLGLRQQRFALAGLSLGVMLLAVVALLAYQRKRLQGQREQMALEQTLLRTQMNPHFIFNALASIQNAVLDNDTRKATLYLAQFGELTRDILETSRKQFIPLAQELGMVENYFELEKIRFGKDLSLELNTQGLNTQQLMVPAMVLQPLVENAIKHGFTGKSHGHVIIGAMATDGLLTLEVIDNGVGLAQPALLPGKKASLGLEILRERLEALQPRSPQHPLQIKNHHTPNGQVAGVCVSLTLPLKYHA